MDGVRGLPLLSGPPPHADDSNYCRKCNKEFNRIFTRAKRCNHCGYQYCSGCCEHSALMPRIGVYNGFDPVDVCSYCIEVLRVTTMGRTQLRSMPLAHLKAYMSAYGLVAPPHVVEKDELVRAVLGAREPNGCLPRVNEEYYRKNSIPQPSAERPRGFLARMADNFADLADLLPQPDAGNRSAPAVPPRPSAPEAPRNTRQRPDAFGPRTGPAASPLRQQAPPRTAPRPNNRPASPTPPPRPRSRPRTDPPLPNPDSRPEARSSRPSVQALPVEQLLEMSSEDISKLSIGVLKAILQQNHVRIPQDALEKRDLVEKVMALVNDAHEKRERDARARVAEEEAEIEAQRRAFEAFEGANGNGKNTTGSEVPNELPKAIQPAAAKLERDGLCVICQDEDANIAVVDCGHLCMCMDCSELVMSSSKECPLCRTRIVTSQRLLRIFKT